MGLYRPKPATRQQYGAHNYSEATAVDRFGAVESALRSVAARFNFGAIYARARSRRGSVLPQNTGIIPTPRPFRGVVRATPLFSNGIDKQTYLSQWGGTPMGWAGDTPTDLQPDVRKNAPWRRRVVNGVAKR